MLEKLKIIFEDEHILVIDKPSGLVVHSDGRTEEESLVDWLKVNFPTLEKVGNPHTLDSSRYTARWGIVNRLDRDTSGLILIAKDEETFLNLQKQFVERSVVKEYSAVVHGEIKNEEKKFTITEPVSRHKKDPRVWVCGTGVGERNTKRDAETEVEIVSSKDYITLLKLFPKTGRTHQLRLHCRFLGHPIVGDKKYGVGGIINEHGTEQIKEVLENLSEDELVNDKNSRLMLHAKSLEFTHPVTKNILKIETENPSDFS
jgi:23S rRNA pseudouridine1911/1915/1917 synthase